MKRPFSVTLLIHDQERLIPDYRMIAQNASVLRALVQKRTSEESKINTKKYTRYKKAQTTIRKHMDTPDLEHSHTV